MLPTAFASSDPPEREQLLGATIRWPRPERLAEPLDLPGPKAEHAAEVLGLSTVGDLLEHLPRDRRRARTVAELALGEVATVVVEVRSISSRSVRKRGMRPLVEATVGDDTGTMKVAFFNQPWLARQYSPGTRLVLHGRYQSRSRFTVQTHARTAEALAGAEEVAHYPASDGLSSTQLLALVREHAAAVADVIEPLPAGLLIAEQLPDRPSALAAAHFPAAQDDPETARRRLAFEELMLAQLAFLRRRRYRDNSRRAPVLDGPQELTRRWISQLLPFPLTSDQERAIAVVEAEIAEPRPMQRLLMGEVGSGKTVVALYALLRAVELGYQGALMAPTETLAEQHYATVQALLPGEMVAVALLTGSTPGRRAADIRGKLASGELSLVVGTHALIQDTVGFARLGVAVVDEQHRFGVRQRAALDDRAPGGGLSPHVLHMTATPIPRTLALAGYGDLDFTLLRELPRGRQPIETFVCSTQPERARAYERMREELLAGRQAFVVCPLVEESELLAARAATAEFERLRSGELRDFSVTLLHGQMRSAAKQAAMAQFASGEADVLVATSVIEVGIDVPNATVMLVEDADRYGISQLHQLRGRIGRGAHHSLCLLFGPKDSARLRAVAGHADGFKLAEIDLELRGQGELVGTRQHGLATFKMAALPQDAALLERAAAWARSITAEDSELEQAEHSLLADALLDAYGAEALAPIRA
ncbi:MAG TPA: ATP-dependent DNA helicase RecG [Solirubrobacteraceae bacterium]